MNTSYQLTPVGEHISMVGWYWYQLAGSVRRAGLCELGSGISGPLHIAPENFLNKPGKQLQQPERGAHFALRVCVCVVRMSNIVLTGLCFTAHALDI